MDRLDSFRDKHVGIHGYIIGKGPSLNRIATLRDELSGGVALCVNDSVHLVEPLRIPILYVVQQDSSLHDKCVPALPSTVHFMNDMQCARDGPKPHKLRKVDVSPWAPRAVLYSAAALGHDVCTLTAIIACKLAWHMGIRDVTFLCFDSWFDGANGEYAAGLPSSNAAGGDPQRHAQGKASITSAAAEIGLKWSAKNF